MRRYPLVGVPGVIVKLGFVWTFWVFAIRGRAGVHSSDEYVEFLSGWQQAYVAALRAEVQTAAPAAWEHLKWGHIVFFLNGPVPLVRAEPARVLFGFWRGQRLRRIEPRLKPLAASTKWQRSS